MSTSMNFTLWRRGSAVAGLLSFTGLVGLPVLYVARPDLDPSPLYGFLAAITVGLGLASVIGYAAVKMTERLEERMDVQFLRMNQDRLDRVNGDTPAGGFLRSVPSTR